MTSTESVRVQYVGQYPFVAISGDGSEQDEVAALGFGDGIVEAAEDVPESTGRDEAFDVAAGLLDRWAQDHRTVSFATRVAGFAAGQVAAVNLPLHGLEGDELLLESVDAEVSEGGTITYRVKGTEGPFNGRWTEYFEKIVEDQRDFQEQQSTGSEEQIIQSTSESATWTITSSDSQTQNPCPILPATVPFTVC